MPHVRHSKRSENRCVTVRSTPDPDFETRPRRAAAFAIRRLDRVGEPLPLIVAAQLHAIDDDLQHGAIAQRRRIDIVERDRAAVDEQPAEALCGAAWRSFPRSRSSRPDPKHPACGRRRLTGTRGGRVLRASPFPNRRCSLSSSTSARLEAAAPTTSTIGKIESEQQARAGRQLAELPRDDFRGFAHDFLAAVAAEGASDARVQQPHVVVDLGRRADGRPRIADAVLLADRDRRRDAVDAIDVRLLHPLEELARVRGQRLDIAPLPFGVDRVEGERRLARSADAGHDDQLADRQRQIDVLEVVRARAAHDDDSGRRPPRPSGCRTCSVLRPC